MLTNSEAVILLTNLIKETPYRHTIRQHINFDITDQFINEFVGTYTPQKSEERLVNMLISLSSGRPGYFKSIRQHVIADLLGVNSPVVIKYDLPPIVNIIESIATNFDDRISSIEYVDGKIIGMGSIRGSHTYIKIGHPDKHISVLRTSIPISSNVLVHEDSVIMGLNNDISIWDIETHNVKSDLQGHTRPVTVIHKIDDSRIISGSDDGFLIIWDLRDKSIETKINVGEPIAKIILTPHSICVISKNDVLSIFENEEKKYSRNDISHAIYLDNGLIIAGTTYGHLIFIQDGTYRASGMMGTSNERIVDMKSTGSKVIVTTTMDTIEIFDLESDKENLILQGTNVEIIPGDRFITGSDQLNVWDINTGNNLLTSDIFTNDIIGIKYLPDKDTILVMVKNEGVYYFA